MGKESTGFSLYFSRTGATLTILINYTTVEYKRDSRTLVNKV